MVKKVGKTLGLGAAETWSAVFQEQLDRLAKNKKPRTDKEIADFMLSEFPEMSPERARLTVSTHRNIFNKGKFPNQKGVAPKDHVSEFDAAGKPIDRPKLARKADLSKSTSAKPKAKADDASETPEPITVPKKAAKKPVVKKAAPKAEASTEPAATEAPKPAAKKVLRIVKPAAAASGN